jgi:hypothetical protein
MPLNATDLPRHFYKKKGIEKTVLGGKQIITRRQPV